MTDIEEKQIFANNLKRYVNASGKQQKEIANELGVAYQTFNGWCKAVSIPTMDKVQKIADYFHIGKTDLLDKPKENSKIYLSKEEENIIIAYRKLSEDGKTLICNSLGIKREAFKIKNETA